MGFRRATLGHGNLSGSRPFLWAWWSEAPVRCDNGPVTFRDVAESPFPSEQQYCYRLPRSG